MILSDHEINQLAKDGMISPYDEEALQPSSYDVRMSSSLLVPRDHTTNFVDLDDPTSYADLMGRHQIGEHGFALHPGEFVLGSTVERVWIPNDLVCRIEGRSSIGRLGLVVHCTAGYVDPGFRGVITLEMTNLLRVPIMLRPGKRVAQLSFARMSGPAAKSYDGRYQDDDGPASSRL